MKVQNTKEEPIYFDHYDPSDLIKVIATQHKVSEHMKKANYNQTITNFEYSGRF